MHITQKLSFDSLLVSTHHARIAVVDGGTQGHVSPSLFHKEKMQVKQDTLIEQSGKYSNTVEPQLSKPLVTRGGP